MAEVKKTKKSTKGNVQSGVATILATFNNTLITLADENGETLWQGSSAMVGFKGAKRSTAYAATKAAMDVAEKVIKKYGMVDGTYDSIKIYPSDRLKKISDEIAVLHDIAWEVSIIDIVGEYPDYKMKFKYSVDVVINDKVEFTAKWYKGEMYMHFNNNDEVWFELIKMESNNSNKGTYPRKFIKYGKSNIYKRAKVLKSSFPID